MNFLSSLSTKVFTTATSAISTVSNGVPGLPDFMIGPKQDIPGEGCIWTIYDGVKRDDKSPVTIFHFNAAGRERLHHLASNAYRKLRTLRHPDVVKFINGVESESEVWIITEPVRRLGTRALGSSGSIMAKEYGIGAILRVLSFLEQEDRSLHGNLSVDSIYETESGEWRLSGFEFCSRIDDASGLLWNVSPYDLSQFPRSIVIMRGWTTEPLRTAPLNANIHAQQTMLLLYALFIGDIRQDNAVSALTVNQRGSFPPALFSAYKALLNKQLSVGKFLQGALQGPQSFLANNEMYKAATLVENFNLGTSGERKSALQLIENASLPPQFIKFKLLPSLMHSFEFSDGQAARQILPHLFPIAKALDLSDEEVARLIMQPLLRVYASPDRALRVALLQVLPSYITYLSAKDVNEKIWPHVVMGFADSVAAVKEETIKAMLILAPLLSDRICNHDLLKQLAATQMDPDASVRTNTCILLGRLAPHLAAITARRVLIPAFSKALKDPFVHCRIAAAMAFMATLDSYDKDEIASRILPALCLALVDSEFAVREQAFKTVDAFLNKVKTLVADMGSETPIENGFSAPPLPAEPPQNAVHASVAKEPKSASTVSGAAGALASFTLSTLAPDSPSGAISSFDLPKPASAPKTRTPVPSASVPSAPRPQLQTNPTSDLIDIANDSADWGEFDSSTKPIPPNNPFSRAQSQPAPKPVKADKRKIPSAKPNKVKLPLDLEATDNWGLDDDVPQQPSLVPQTSAPIRPTPASQTKTGTDREPVKSEPRPPSATTVSSSKPPQPSMSVSQPTSDPFMDLVSQQPQKPASVVPDLLSDATPQPKPHSPIRPIKPVQKQDDWNFFEEATDVEQKKNETSSQNMAALREERKAKMQALKQAHRK